MKNITLAILISSIILVGCIKPTTALPSINQNTATTTPSSTPVAQIDFEKIEARVPILIYHHIREYRETDSANDQTFIISPNQLREQLQYLKNNNFTSITFKNLTDYFNGQLSLPEKPVIISFDDGVITQYNNAFNLLKEFGFVATFFVFVNPIGKSENYMTWEQLLELRQAGMEIGSHGWYHQYLSRINTDELARELVTSKKVLEEKLGGTVSSIAYPFGDYDEAVTQAVAAAGYQSARDIINGTKHTKKDLLNLRAYFITNDLLRFQNIVNKIN